MNEDRRSGRARKPVTYPGCDLSDDDFADTTPPPPKKTKTGNNKPNKVKTSSKDKGLTLDLDSSLKSKKPRKPPAEKLFDRELEKALQISLLETNGSQDFGDIGADSGPPPLLPLSPILHHMDNIQEPPSLIKSKSTRCSTQVDVNKSKFTDTSKAMVTDTSIAKVIDAFKTTVKDSSKSKEIDSSRSKNSSLPYTTVMDDSIQILGLGEAEEENDDMGKSRRRTVRKIIMESDDEAEEASDFTPDGGDNSDDDDDGAEDEVESEDSSQVDSDDSNFAPKSKKKQLSTKKETVSSKAKTSTKISNATNIQGKQTNKTSDKKSTKSSPLAKPSLSSAPRNPATKKISNLKSSPFVPTEAALKSHPVPTRPSSASPTSSLHTQRSSPSCLTAQWKPPARAKGDTSSLSMTKSPSSGLRLGLSRNMKVKPLHSSVKVT